MDALDETGIRAGFVKWMPSTKPASVPVS